MKTCERWDLLNGFDPCPHEVSHAVRYTDGVELDLCIGCTIEAAEGGEVEVTKLEPRTKAP